MHERANERTKMTTTMAQMKLKPYWIYEFLFPYCYFPFLPEMEGNRGMEVTVEWDEAQKFKDYVFSSTLSLVRFSFQQHISYEIPAAT